MILTCHAYAFFKKRSVNKTMQFDLTGGFFLGLSYGFFWTMPRSFWTKLIENKACTKEAADAEKVQFKIKSTFCSLRKLGN